MPTSPEATTNAGQTEPEYVPLREDDPAFIGPPRTSRFWTYIQPIASDLQGIRDLNIPVVVDEDPMQALEIREGEVHPRQRGAAKFIKAKEKAGQWLAVHLSARGISTSTLTTLLELEDTIRIASQIAQGKKQGNVQPTIEDQVKAAQAVAVGAKSVAELSEILIKQLAPIAPPEDDKPKSPRGPSRDQPVTAIQAENVYINGNGQSSPASNGTPLPERTVEQPAG